MTLGAENRCADCGMRTVLYGSIHSQSTEIRRQLVRVWCGKYETLEKAASWCIDRRMHGTRIPFDEEWERAVAIIGE